MLGSSGVPGRAPFGRLAAKAVAALAADRDAVIAGKTNSMLTGELAVRRRSGGGNDAPRDDELHLDLRPGPCGTETVETVGLSSSSCSATRRPDRVRALFVGAAVVTQHSLRELLTVCQ